LPSSARWPIAKDGEQPIPRIPPSSRMSARCSERNASHVVQPCPSSGTYWRGSSQIGQAAGGCSDGGYCVPQATHTKVAIARQDTRVDGELRDVADGLWIWRVAYPDWHSDAGWPRVVTSTCVESGGEIAVIDALAPSDEASEVWARLDARPPTLAVVIKPDHVRDVDLFVRRYGARAFGPYLFWRTNVPETELEGVQPGDGLPGGLVALYDGRGRNETPLWLPEQRAFVCADALHAPEGELRVWATPWHEARTLPALRAWLDLPFEHVIVSHGEPVHDRAAFERALALPPLGD